MNKKRIIFLKGERIKTGREHPIKLMIKEICKIFTPLGYRIVETNEIENEWYNFDKLNIEKGHPARKKTDTFYFSEKILLRTHTSNSEIRIMKKNKNKEENLKIISIGKVYRRDEDDATHTHQFTQLELFSISEESSLIELEKMIKLFIEKIFGKNKSIRLRSSYFPFTEPSFEVDLECEICKKEKKCSICKKSGWIEIMGAGLFRNNILHDLGYKKETKSFALGMGIERILMIKYGIKDIRQFYINDVKFLEQFPC